MPPPTLDQSEQQLGGQTPQGVGLDAVMAAIGGGPLDEAGRAEQLRQDQVLTQLVKEFDYFKTQRTGRYHARWNECYKLYRIQAPDERKTGEWRSKISKPYAFNSVEDVLPHYMDGVFGGEKWFNLVSDSESDEMIEAHETLLVYQAEEQMDLEGDAEEYLRQALIYGTTFAYVGWRESYRKKKMWVKKESPVDPSLSVPVIEEFNVADYVGNTFDVIDIWNIYLHPLATRKNFIKLYWEEWRTLDWIKAHKEFKQENVAKITLGMATQPNNESIAEFKQFETGSGNSQTTQSYGERYRVVYCFDDDNKKQYCFLDNKLLLQEDDYPFFHGQCPIVWTVYTPIPKEFYGVGLVEINANLIHMGNSLLNAKMDNIQMAMNHMLEVRDGAIEDEKTELVYRPFGVIHSDDGQSVRPLPTMMMTQDVWNVEKDLENDIHRSTGTGGELSGASTNATGGTAISLRQKGQLMRLEYAIRKAGKSIARIFGQMMENNMQFYPMASVQAVLGPRLFANWQVYKPDTITITAKIRVEPAGLFADDDILRQQFTNMVNVLGANPNTSNLLDWTYLAKKTLKLFGESDPQQALKKHGTFNLQEYAYAQQENLAMANGEPVPPATPQEDEQIHEEVHMTLAAARPDLMAGSLGQHLASHNQAIMERQQMMMQLQNGPVPAGPPAGPGGGQGPGSAPSGNKGGGVNPNRQPQATNQQGITRQHARMMGRK